MGDVSGVAVHVHQGLLFSNHNSTQIYYRVTAHLCRQVCLYRKSQFTKERLVAIKMYLKHENEKLAIINITSSISNIIH